MACMLFLISFYTSSGLWSSDSPFSGAASAVKQKYPVAFSHVGLPFKICYITVHVLGCIWGIFVRGFRMIWFCRVAQKMVFVFAVIVAEKCAYMYM